MAEVRCCLSSPPQRNAAKTLARSRTDSVAAGVRSMPYTAAASCDQVVGALLERRRLGPVARAVRVDRAELLAVHRRVPRPGLALHPVAGGQQLPADAGAGSATSRYSGSACRSAASLADGHEVLRTDGGICGRYLWRARRGARPAAAACAHVRGQQASRNGVRGRRRRRAGRSAPADRPAGRADRGDAAGAAAWSRPGRPAPATPGNAGRPGHRRVVRGLAPAGRSRLRKPLRPAAVAVDAPVPSAVAVPLRGAGRWRWTCRSPTGQPRRRSRAAGPAGGPQWCGCLAPSGAVGARRCRDDRRPARRGVAGPGAPSSAIRRVAPMRGLPVYPSVRAAGADLPAAAPAPPGSDALGPAAGAVAAGGGRTWDPSARCGGAAGQRGRRLSRR